MGSDALVLDASAYIEALTGEPAAADAISARLEGSSRWLVPGSFDVECLSVCRRFPAGSEREQVVELVVEALSASLLDRIDTAPFLPRMRELLPNVTAFDTAYVVLAEAFGAPLLTCDRRLSRSPGPRCEFIVV